MTNSNNAENTKPRKQAPSFEVPTSRSERAKGFITGKGEDVAAVAAADKLETTEPKKQISDKSYKACVRYMQDQGITDPSSLEFKRLNCDIPKDLHNWLNVFGRTSSEYSSMTEIVIEQLGKFAKERGFKVE